MFFEMVLIDYELLIALRSEAGSGLRCMAKTWKVKIKLTDRSVTTNTSNVCCSGSSRFAAILCTHCKRVDVPCFSEMFFEMVLTDDQLPIAN